MRNLLVSGIVFALSLTAFADQASLKQKMIKDLDLIGGIFQAQYAPAAWKQKYAGWKLDEQIQACKDAVNANPDITVKDYQRILAKFFVSMKDYHVSVQFYSTESATLPFSVKGANDKFFLTYINRAKLSETTVPFHVGDELVSFGDRPTKDAVAELQALLGANAELTDRALAEMYLTRRSAKKALPVPQGPVTIVVKPQGSDKTITHQLIWDYTPEQIHFNQDARKAFGRVSSQKDFLLGRSLLSPVADYFADTSKADEEDPFMLGGRKSFTPALGKKVWESGNDSIFHSYIYQTADRRLIGYLRLPSYTPEDANKAVKEFGETIGKFEAITDALVIDQVNNPGGSVFYLYALVSMLSDQAIHTPLHSMAITQSDVDGAISNLAELQNVRTDEDARKVLGETMSGYPTSYEVARFMTEFYRFIISEWNEGRMVTRPSYLYGVDQINPSATHYTKPILLLTNSLDFSGGDFFPATLQDNKRVKILGTRTAGAGGYVLEVKYPNHLGVAGFRLTGSIAKRVDDNPIENLGVRPDIEYRMTEADYQGGFASYAKAINDAVAGMIK